MGIWQDFSGKSARRDIRRGQEQANAELTGSENKGYGFYNEGIGRFDPYAQGGLTGYKAYLASMGLGSPEEQADVEDRYMRDPMQQALMDRIQKFATRGRAYSGQGGAATQAFTNALLENWQKYQQGLKGVGDQGLQARGAQAGFDQAKGELAFGAGQQRAGVNIGAANALAASRSILANNVIGAVGAGAKFAAAI